MQSGSDDVLLLPDWSQLNDQRHTAKMDQTQLSHGDDIGDELYTALLVDAADGLPLAPMKLELLAVDGVHSARYEEPSERQHHLEQLRPTMQAARDWGFSKSVVHVVDREADAQSHFRRWQEDGEWFLVRADFTRKVEWTTASSHTERLRLPECCDHLAACGAFADAWSTRQAVRRLHRRSADRPRPPANRPRPNSGSRPTALSATGRQSYPR